MFLAIFDQFLRLLVVLEGGGVVELHVQEAAKKLKWNKLNASLSHFLYVFLPCVYAFTMATRSDFSRRVDKVRKKNEEIWRSAAILRMVPDT